MPGAGLVNDEYCRSSHEGLPRSRHTGNAASDDKHVGIVCDV